MRRNRLSLSTKLALITGLLICSLFATLGVALRVLGRLESTAAELTILREAQRCSQNADMAHDALRNAVLDGLLRKTKPADGTEPGELSSEVLDAADDLRAEMSHLNGMALSPELREVTNGTRKLVTTYIAHAEQTASLLTIDRELALKQHASFDSAFDDARSALANQTETLGRASQAAADVRARAGEEAKLGILLTSVLTSVVGAALIALIARSIRRSLERVRDVARAVAAGTLDSRTTETGKDEIGALGEAVNEMAQHLQQTIGNMRLEASRSAFGATLAEALDMADSEREAHAIVRRAMEQVSPAHPMELLLADSSNAHLERAAEHPSAGGAGCKVDSPFGCVAVRRGTPQTFADSEALNACPHLRGRTCGSIAAICVPVTFMGRALGVLHTTGPAREPLSEEQVSRLRTIGAQVGSRIGTVRAFRLTQLQASTDALTGLPNRRALEEATRDVVTKTEPFALLMCDLDHFKRLNDEHGHQAGDAALRIFSEALRASLRSEDLAARWGGEEFCVLLKGAGAADAVGWADRLRGRLAESLAKTASPLFTASFGVADSTMSRDIDELVRMADGALYQAKRGGRDRAEIADELAISGDHPRPDTEQRSSVNLWLLSKAV